MKQLISPSALKEEDESCFCRTILKRKLKHSNVPLEQNAKLTIAALT
jgi:hypothetical protein